MIPRLLPALALALLLGAPVAFPRATAISPAPEVWTTDRIAALIDEAEVGAAVVVPPGVYRGPLQIRKSITLDGGGAATIDGGGKGTVVEILAPDVTLRGFTVRASGSNVEQESAAIRAETGPVIIENNRIEDTLFGIDLRSAAESRVSRNFVRCKPLEPGRRGDGIRLWWSPGSTVEDNDVRFSRDMVFWYSEGLTIRRNRVEDSRYGLHFMYSHETLVTGNTLAGNSVGVYLMYSNGITLENNTLVRNRGASGYGVGLKDCDRIAVRGNAILANRVGIYLDNSPSSVGSTGIIEGNIVAFNEMGMLVTPNTHDNVLTGNSFVENEEQAAMNGRGDLTANRYSRDGVGNFWSDYAGFDLDNNGIGDLPYESRSLFENILAVEPNLRFFVHGPAQQAIEFTARALPAMRPAPKFVDEFPLARAPVIEVDSLGGNAAPGAATTATALGAMLLTTAGGLAWLARLERAPVPGRSVP